MQMNNFKEFSTAQLRAERAPVNADSRPEATRSPIVRSTSPNRPVTTLQQQLPQAALAANGMAGDFAWEGCHASA